MAAGPPLKIAGGAEQHAGDLTNIELTINVWNARFQHRWSPPVARDVSDSNGSERASDPPILSLQHRMMS
jgi:hypothetical protein